ncbi:hypothetical protein DICPUDRAFT_73870 [Dictyostelium purpureum]|uniref:F-box domain-containing protein n=1 Tax=Dictyostelium purpureum TaxID=5786 RepID=F0Z640_DICPU|nr:uncharacterized protein DICPUDRAFT_73870 [Dictyostelium purpureum]EGC40533.1 hypothetical protein DICPUDRAFT_73870 [Dictyostelium purpureum]|eukprot:XP_003282869.1 hypothetical protein DICPUDRAFT_73870 [Dictyostelium purpureum]
MDINMMDIEKHIEKIKIFKDDEMDEMTVILDDDDEYISTYIQGQKDIHQLLPTHVIQVIFQIALMDNGNIESTIETWDCMNRDRLNIELVCKDWCSIIKSSCNTLSLSLNNLLPVTNQISTFTALKKLEIVCLNNDYSDSDDSDDSDTDTDSENDDEPITIRKNEKENKNKIIEIHDDDSDDEEHASHKSNQASDTIIKHLITIIESQHPTLRILDLSMLGLREYHIEKLLPYLSKHRYIEELILDSNPIGDQGIIFISDLLKSNSVLKELDVQSSKAENGLEYIGAAIAQNKTLKKLIWSYNKSSYSSIIYLSNGLRVNNILESLVLRGCKIEGWGAYSLSETLGINKSLKELDLAQNEFGDRGGCSIAEKLNLHPSLTTLDISCNSISTEAFNSIFQALESNHTLTSLNLSKNIIDTSIPMESVFFSLSHNKTLTSLNLSECSLQNYHFDLISQGLVNNNTLLKLDLSRNNISSIDPFLQVLCKNKTLKSINLSKHKIKLNDINILLHYIIKKNQACRSIKLKTIVHQIEFINLSLSPEPVTRAIYDLLKEYRSKLNYTKIKI